jgi:hypothetical protein
LIETVFRAIFRVCCLLLLFGFGSLASGTECLVSSKVQPKPIRRPVVFNIPSGLIGYSVSNYEGWVFRQTEGWKRVALQVDEKNSDGSYVLEEGLPFTKGTDNGISDQNDEISFRGRDLGESFNGASSLKAAPIDRFVAYQAVHVCLGGEYRGSLMLGVSKKVDPWPFTPIYKFKTKQVDTYRYRYLFHRSHPMLLGNVWIVDRGKEQLAFSESVFAMPIRPNYWFLPNTEVSHADFVSEIECWQNGPVRSIVAIGAKMSRFFSLFKLHLFSELIFYEDFFQIPTRIEMIFDAHKYLEFGSGLGYRIGFPESNSWQVQTNLTQFPETVDYFQKDPKTGQQIVKKTAYDISPEGEYFASGSRGQNSFKIKVQVEQKAAKLVPPPFIRVGTSDPSQTMKKTWPWVEGPLPNLSLFLDISQVSKGQYDFALDLMLSDQANDQFEDFKSLTISARSVGPE